MFQIVMKKVMIAVLSMLFIQIGQSQDTVDGLHDNIFYNVMPTWGKPVYPDLGLIVGNGCGVMAKEMYAPDKNPIKIYGIAAAMMTPLDIVYIPEDVSTEEAQEWWELYYSEYIDTSLNEAYEYLGVYLAQPDSSLAVQREVMVHRLYDTAAYYVATGQAAYYNPNFVYPVYEKYFD